MSNGRDAHPPTTRPELIVWPPVRRHSDGPQPLRLAASTVVRTHATPKKLTALIKKLPNAAINKPLIAGPIMRPDPVTALFKETAFGKFSSPTRSFRKPLSAGSAPQIIQSRISCHATKAPMASDNNASAPASGPIGGG